MATVLSINLNRLVFNIPSLFIDLCKDIQADDSLVCEALINDGKKAQLHIDRLKDWFTFRVEGGSYSAIQLLEDCCNCTVKNVCGNIYHMTSVKNEKENEAGLAEKEACVDNLANDEEHHDVGDEQTSADVTMKAADVTIKAADVTDKAPVCKEAVYTTKPRPLFYGKVLEDGEIPWHVDTLQAYKCYMCDLKHVKLDQLKAHVSRQHKISFEEYKVTSTVMADAFICNICDHTSPNIDAIRRHVRKVHNMVVAVSQGRGRRVLHSSMPGYKCKLCPMKSLTLKALKQHVKRLHRNHPRCSETCRYVQELQMEKCAKGNSRYKTRIKCPSCSKDCPAWWLRRHIAIYHSEQPNLEQLKKTAKELCYRQAPMRQMAPCPKCQIQIRRDSIPKHLKYACHGKPLQDGVEADNSQYKCSLCNRTFASQRSVARHRALAHKVNTDAEGKPIEFLSCQICSKQYKNKNKLKDHMICHTAKLDFACDLCGKKMKHKRSVEEHKRVVHNRVFRYPCDTCGRNFDKPLRLERHRCIPYQENKKADRVEMDDNVVDGNEKSKVEKMLNKKILDGPHPCSAILEIKEETREVEARQSQEKGKPIAYRIGAVTVQELSDVQEEDTRS